MSNFNNEYESYDELCVMVDDVGSDKIKKYFEDNPKEANDLQHKFVVEYGYLNDSDPFKQKIVDLLLSIGIEF